LATCSAIPLPEGTQFYAGVDFGYTNPTAITIRALTPEGIHYRVAEFYKSRMMVEDLVKVCQQRKQIYNIKTFICDPSSPANIEALNRGGCPAIGADNQIRLGIDRHSQLIKGERFFVFRDENPMGLDEYSTYHYPEPKDYKIDDNQKEVEPVKASDHGCDADRYVTMHLWDYKETRTFGKDIPGSNEARLRWLKAGGSSRFGKG